MRQFTQVQTAAQLIKFSHFSTEHETDVRSADRTSTSRARGRHTSMHDRWCPHGTSAIRGLRGAIRHTWQLLLSVSGVSTWLSVWLSISTTSTDASSTSELSCRQHHTAYSCCCEHRHCDLSPAEIVAEYRHRCRTFYIKYAKLRGGKQMQNYA